MPYPSVTNNQSLNHLTLEEFQNLVSLLFGYLSEQHDENGAHTDITATSVTVEEGGTFGDDVIAGNVSIGSAGNTVSGYGIQMRTDATGSNTIREFHLASDVQSSLGARMMAYDASGDFDMGGWRWNSSRTAYEFIPDSSTKTTKTISLGSPTDSSQGGWWSDGYISDIYTGNNSTDIVGAWTAVSHNGANFTADSGSWTVDSGDQITYAYTITRKKMTVAFTITGTDVSATPTELRIAIPAGKTAVKRMDNMGLVSDAGTVQAALIYVAASGTTINIQKLTGTFATTAADNTNVIGQITFEIQ